jgi:hypothetical protein
MPLTLKQVTRLLTTICHRAQLSTVGAATEVWSVDKAIVEDVFPFVPRTAVGADVDTLLGSLELLVQQRVTAPTHGSPEVAYAVVIPGRLVADWAVENTVRVKVAVMLLIVLRTRLVGDITVRLDGDRFLVGVE